MCKYCSAHDIDIAAPPAFEAVNIGISRPTWENGNVVVDDVEWTRKPDGSWRHCDRPRQRLSLDQVFEQIRAAVTAGDVAIITRTHEPGVVAIR